MDLAEDIAYFTAMKRRISIQAASKAANAAAEEFQKIVRDILSHPGRAPEGAPPGLQSGHLRESMTVFPAAGGFVRATAKVAPTAIYARVQNDGAWLWPSSAQYLHWVDERGSAYHKLVHVKRHPYMRPAHDVAIASGRLSRAAAGAFLSVELGT